MMAELDQDRQMEISLKIQAYLTDLLDMVERSVQPSLDSVKDVWFWQYRLKIEAIDKVKKLRGNIEKVLARAYPIIIQGS